MPMLPGCRKGADTRAIPAHPYRDTALVYGAMSIVLVIVAALTGGQTPRAIGVAVIFFVTATAWSSWGFRKRIRVRDEAATAGAAARETPPGRNANSNGNGRGRQW